MACPKSYANAPIAVKAVADVEVVTICCGTSISGAVEVGGGGTGSRVRIRPAHIEQRGGGGRRFGRGWRERALSLATEVAENRGGDLEPVRFSNEKLVRAGPTLHDLQGTVVCDL